MPRRPGLDSAAVVQAAVELLDVEGPAALSLGRLAERLGIQTPSLYNHVDGMPDLLRRLALRNLQEMAACVGDAAIGRSGATALLAVGEAYRAYIKQHPGLYMASLRASGAQATPDPELVAAEERVLRVVLAVLASLGIQEADAIHAARGLRSIVHGFATLEIAGGFGLPLDCDESFRRLLQMWVAGLQKEQGAWPQPSQAQPSQA
jgi:AcrR family transcriptional regulator